MTVVNPVRHAPETPIEHHRPHVSRPLLATAAAVVLLAATTVLALLPLASPAAPRGATAAGFPVQRAEQDLAVVAAAAHPLGSPAQDSGH